jgi:hypothetical protein
MASAYCKNGWWKDSNKLLEGKPGGKRKNWRSRLRWIYDVEKDLRNTGVNRGRIRASERTEWAYVMRQAKARLQEPLYKKKKKTYLSLSENTSLASESHVFNSTSLWRNKAKKNWQMSTNINIYHASVRTIIMQAYNLRAQSCKRVVFFLTHAGIVWVYAGTVKVNKTLFCDVVSCTKYR